MKLIQGLPSKMAAIKVKTKIRKFDKIWKVKKNKAIDQPNKK